MIKTSYPGKLTLNIICKDESENVAGCIESFLPIADEIIVNDTGSSDDTLEKLSKYNGTLRIIQSKWNEDFSQARNTAIKFSTYGWIFWADMDDRLPPESVPLINKLKLSPLDSIYYFNIINTKAGKPIGANFLQCRMFPNSDRIYFESPIHERVSDTALSCGLTPMEANINIHHTGYENDEMVISKTRRNIRLMRNIPNYKIDVYWLKKIGESYKICGAYELAYKYLSDSYLIDKNIETLFLMGDCRMLQNDFENALKYYQLCLTYDENDVAVNYHAGRCSHLIGKFMDAIRYYENVLNLPDKTEIKVNYGKEPKIFAYNNLMKLYIENNMPAALTLFIEKYKGLVNA